MTIKKLFPFLFFCSVLFFACNENMPIIKCLNCPDDTPPPPIPQEKTIFIEEFTGVRCIGCPTGSIEIEQLRFQYGERLVSVSIHPSLPGNLTTPYTESTYDFRTEDGTEIINFLGLPEAIPSAVFGRRLYPGEPDLQFTSVASWGGRVESQIDDLAKVNMEVDLSFDESDRKVFIKVNNQAVENIDEEVRITVMITETDIIDHQLTYDSSPESDPDYIHKHVLRDIITAYDGEILSTSILAGEILEKEYTFNVPEAWNEENCEVIVFTHLSQSSKEILQAKAKKITE